MLPVKGSIRYTPPTRAHLLHSTTVSSYMVTWYLGITLSNLITIALCQSRASHASPRFRLIFETSRLNQSYNIEIDGASTSQTTPPSSHTSLNVL